MSEFCHDVDPIETKDWLLSIESVIQREGKDRAKYIIDQVLQKMCQHGINFNFYKKQNYINSIIVDNEPDYPGNIILEKKIQSIICWNAIMIVLRASKKDLDLGGHLSSFQSSASIYEVCFNHFFKTNKEKKCGDLIYFQGHISPGIYSRAFLEGRLTKNQLDNFRQEIKQQGLPSYPHPKLMPNFWQFPTVSMGLGPVNAIYQAKFLKYLNNRNIKDTEHQKVYAFIGDGEMDEPESKGLLNIASREKLDNLCFIINCNLQRLDGPVTGNGKIIFELENIFLGSGWEVIKVIWGSNWDHLLKKDHSGKLIQLMNETVDGDYQNFRSQNGAYIRKYFFGKYNETYELVKNMSDDEIWDLQHGGHDTKKIYAALKYAHTVKYKPVVILAHTIKGYGMGKSVESKNIAHQIKKINIEDIKYIRKKLNISISDEDIYKLSYIQLDHNSQEYQYLHHRRKKLGGYLPYRNNKSDENLIIPKLKVFQSLLLKQEKKISTTKAFVRILNIILRDQNIKNRIVPIIADEARTFGMESLFRQIGIYNPHGQKYTPQDQSNIAYYKEDRKGQILQEGINELGAGSSWLAAATSYSNSNIMMIPFYIYYSIFGFQRIGDLFWAAGDQQAKGFLIGGTSGRTTLNGEGLQHEDGHSHIYSLTIPNCISYDPAYAYELAVIIHNGLLRMYGPLQENIYFYITTLNESYIMPEMPKLSQEGICRGIYKLETLKGKHHKIQLLGSGALLNEVRKAANILSKEYEIESDVYSVTSFTELARDGQDCDRWNMLHPDCLPRVPYVTKTIKNLPTIASTDYMKLFAEQIRKYIPSINYKVLGTDGYGRSDSRKNLREYFEVDYSYIIIASLYELFKCNLIEKNIILKAINKFKIDINKINPRMV